MDNSFWLQIGISVVLNALKDSIKNPVKKAALKPAMIKIASTILAIWNDEPNFEETVHAKRDYELAKMKSSIL